MLYLALLVPVGWFATANDRYQVDGDAVAYMDLADLIHAHRWAGVVNSYWHPLYPGCLALAQVVFHPARQNELGAYYAINFALFLAQLAAMGAFTTALHRLRQRSLPPDAAPVLGLQSLRLLGLALVVIASQRELSMGKIRPDALLQALLLAALAALLSALQSESLWFPALLGLALGLAYLTKSFAFLIALVSLGAMVVVQVFLQRRPVGRALAAGGLALLFFAGLAGPYVAALSRQKGRFDFGDSGALNYAWYAGGVEKMHLEPWMTASFGQATVTLKHPEVQLLASPGIYSYRAEPYGTYPDWFDTTFFNERITPRLNLPVLLRRDARNVVLVARYLLNHPEGLLLLAVLLACGARLRLGDWRKGEFWLVPIALGLLMWMLYGLVNVEERYVTLAYLLVVLPLFAALRWPIESHALQGGAGASATALAAGGTARALVVLLAAVSVGESLRLALEARRDGMGLPHAWYSPRAFGAAAGLAAMGVAPGDEVACMGAAACLNEEYWARLAGVRVLTEVYHPNPAHLLEQWAGLPNRAQVVETLRGQGAKVLVASFAVGSAGEGSAADSLDSAPGSGPYGWQRLGTTDFYALPLTVAPPQRLAGSGLRETPGETMLPAALPWDTHREGGP